MNDIERHDRKLFIGELLSPARLVLTILFVVPMAILFVRFHAWPFLWLIPLLITCIWILSSKKAAYLRRFSNKRYEGLWHGCVDRLQRFEDVLKKLRKEQIADLQEMPKTVRRVGESLYLALRRADIIATEVQKTEQGIYHAPPAWQSPSSDSQATELYRIADRNIADYRAQFAGVMAGVHRAEAQSAVFMTTLDSLRMKMIGFRLVGKSPELSSRDFLEALGEAKLQLSAIDQALDELDFSQMPQMIAAIPPPVQDELKHLEQGN
jgi:hypothetical protein